MSEDKMFVKRNGFFAISYLMNRKIMGKKCLRPGFLFASSKYVGQIFLPENLLSELFGEKITCT